MLNWVKCHLGLHNWKKYHRGHRVETGDKYSVLYKRCLHFGCKYNPRGIPDDNKNNR